MAKKKADSSKSSRKKGGLPLGWIAAAAIAAILVIGPTGMDLFELNKVTDGKSFHIKGGETRPVLDPLQFPNSRVTSAYSMAKAHPDAMDQVYCYCECDKRPTFHKSLLSCFATSHGAS